jgi:1-acyl-sn-glycerol-3-phosphate acyltransferase
MDSDESVQTYSLKMETRYRVIRAIIGFLVRLFCRLDIRGLEHVPDKGPYLLLINHLHWMDAPVLMTAFPHRAWVFAAAKREKHWFFGPLFRSLDAIFVHRGEADRKALRRALAVLKGGGVLGVAPEGTRSHTGGLQKGRSGAAYMAYHTGVKLVPVVATGQKTVFPPWKRLRRAPVRVVFGPPFWPPPVPTGEKASAADVRAFTEEIMYRLSAMLPTECRGVYADVAEKRPELIELYSPLDASQSSGRS